MSVGVTAAQRPSSPMLVTNPITLTSVSEDPCGLFLTFFLTHEIAQCPSPDAIPTETPLATACSGPLPAVRFPGVRKAELGWLAAGLSGAERERCSSRSLTTQPSCPSPAEPGHCTCHMCPIYLCPAWSQCTPLLWTQRQPQPSPRAPHSAPSSQTPERLKHEPEPLFPEAPHPIPK